MNSVDTKTLDYVELILGNLDWKSVGGSKIFSWNENDWHLFFKQAFIKHDIDEINKEDEDTNLDD
jgi:hypothetical protein